MKYPIALTAALLAGFALYATAQTPVVAAASGGDVATTTGSTTKIAVIAFQAAVTNTNEFQRNFADLQKKYEPKRQELKTLNDQIDSLKKQLQAQGDTLSDQERESRSNTINEKERLLQRNTQDDTNDFQQEMQETYNGVASKVGDLLAAYAQQHGYTLVLDGGNEQAQAVVYASPSTDITKEILDAYNQKSGVPAPPQQQSSGVSHPAPGAAHPAAPKAPAQHVPQH
jgi:outer membrane protein